MKKLFYLLLALPMMLAACEEAPVNEPTGPNTPDGPDGPDVPVVEEPKLSLTSEATLSFSEEGGEGVITYTLENKKEDVELSATCEADWVSAPVVGETITFTVSANEGEARQTKIVVSYETQTFEVAIAQAAVAETPVVDYEMSWARRADSAYYEMPNNYFYLTFGDANETLYFTLALVGTESQYILQAGTYSTVSENLLLQGTELFIFDGERIISFTTGRATVTYEDEIYTLDIYLTGDDNVTYHITYEGIIEKMEANIPTGPQNFEPVAVEAVVFAPGNFVLKLFVDNYYAHELDMYDLAGKSSDYLSEGRYVLGADDELQYISEWAQYSIGNGQQAVITAAEIEITHHSNNTSRIQGFIESELGHHIDFDWNGPVLGFDLTGYETPEALKNLNFEATYLSGELYTSSQLGGLAPNNYYFTLSDAVIDRNNPVPNSTYFYFDLYSDTLTEDNTIPYGTYPVDVTSSWQAGTVSLGKTYGFKINSSGTDYAARYLYTGGVVVVSENKIEAEFTTEQGTTVTVTYEGDLAITAYSSGDDDDDQGSDSNITTDATFNCTNVTMSANYYGDYYTPDTDNYTVRLYEDPNMLSGVFIQLELLADPTADDWDLTYHALQDLSMKDPEDYINSFIPGYIQDGYTYASWYGVLNGNGGYSYEFAPIYGGTVDIVKNDDGSRTFIFDCTDDAGVKITGTMKTMAETPAAMMSAKGGNKAMYSIPQSLVVR